MLSISTNSQLQSIPKRIHQIFINTRHFHMARISSYNIRNKQIPNYIQIRQHSNNPLPNNIVTIALSATVFFATLKNPLYGLGIVCAYIAFYAVIDFFI